MLIVFLWKSCCWHVHGLLKSLREIPRCGEGLRGAIEGPLWKLPRRSGCTLPASVPCDAKIRWSRLITARLPFLQIGIGRFASGTKGDASSLGVLVLELQISLRRRMLPEGAGQPGHRRPGPFQRGRSSKFASAQTAVSLPSQDAICWAAMSIAKGGRAWLCFVAVSDISASYRAAVRMPPALAV